ncbi:RNA polymerase sigma-70 factor, ECF subfamily [Tenacibaculum mesophilum]|uniref:RNA polymerase sigma factor n=1 Tax=Tenacibaculum mesophilum TaxID=104268 RepID=A0ABN5T1B4_9FLAO|nr:RNA polymerase sigma factor [Tenacibaculum mesophilum]AZJ31082.1 RNA polymerase sigma factor [Tenacibaculum mesophilum]QFS29129.1 sigma-70 family RNA polymerase sigma factor [Tenacibaculum mesophilum]SHF52089.1 RNA polymerase sigma-70 factor, ECF subfamily [Tenacibaculum mesophilum]
MKSTKQLHQSVIDACKNNDAKAQMQLYDLYCDAMYTVALRYVKDSFIAEDVMQEAFVKAFKNIDSYKEGVVFGAWLKRIVINQSIDYLKKRKLELVSINEEITTVADDDNWNVAARISYQDIVNCIQQLKEKYRVVLTLFLLEGYDHGEISQILGISEVSSRTHLLRGKRQVQEQLKAVHHV